MDGLKTILYIYYFFLPLNTGLKAHSNTGILKVSNFDLISVSDTDSVLVTCSET